MKHSWRYVTVVALILAGLVATEVQAQRKPDPKPTTRGSERYQPDTQNFSKAYQSANEPVTAIVVGNVRGAVDHDDPTIVSFDATNDSDMLRAEIERHFIKARVELVDAKTLRAAEEALESKMKGRRDENAAVLLLNNMLDADQILYIWLKNDPTGRVRYRATVELVQAQRGRQIGGFAFDWERGAEAKTIKAYAAAITQKVFNDFIDWYGTDEEARQYTLMMVGIDDIAEVAKVRAAFEQIPGMERVRERGFAQFGDQSAVKMRADYRGRPFDLAVRLQNAAREELNMIVSVTDGSDGEVVIKAREIPRPVQPRTTTEPNAPLPRNLLFMDPVRGEAVRAHLLDKYAQEGRPTIAVVVNRELTQEDQKDPQIAERLRKLENARNGSAPATPAPTSVTTDNPAVVVNLTTVNNPVNHGGSSNNNTQPKPDSGELTEKEEGYSNYQADTRRMEDFLYNRFLNILKLQMIDPDFARDRLRQQLNGDKDVLSGNQVAFLLGKAADVDIVVHGIGKVDRTDQGSKLVYTFRAVRINDGRVLASAGDSKDLFTNREDNIDQVLNDIADNIVGSLADQMLTSWTPPRTLRVAVVNAKTQRDVFVMMDLIKTEIGDPIESVTYERHNAEGGGIGFFTIRYRMTYEDLIERIMKIENNSQFDLEASDTTRDTLTVRMRTDEAP